MIAVASSAADRLSAELPMTRLAQFDPYHQGIAHEPIRTWDCAVNYTL
jgi:hypothetical protein